MKSSPKIRIISAWIVVTSVAWPSHAQTAAPAAESAVGPTDEAQVYRGKMKLDVIRYYEGQELSKMSNERETWNRFYDHLTFEEYLEHLREERQQDPKRSSLQMSVGHLRMGFESRDRPRRDKSGHYDDMPKIEREATADVSLRISDISEDLAFFHVDVTTQSFYVKRALSDAKSDTLVSRYRAEVVSCDGRQVSDTPTFPGIRDRVRELKDLDFNRYMGCELRLTRVASEMETAEDPYGFMKRIAPERDPIAGAKIVGTFVLTMGSHGKANLVVDDVSAPAKIEATRVLRGAKFTMQTPNLGQSPEQSQVILAATRIGAAVAAYADDRLAARTAASEGPRGQAIDDAAFAKHRQEIESNLDTVREGFSKLSIKDKFLVLSIVGRAYRYDDQIGQLIGRGR